ncbi:MAG: hypothetical protein CMI16_14130 [Opitutaceae bacterium]|nr:hypothetical protein [Opitutaceae bacterium]|tara:strand:+ start:298 stop:1008 length:711 start_codon:yes stop_codon:yes gene_type:complete
MITLGIDLASQLENTAVCAIEWTATEAIVRDIKLGCTDVYLDELIAKAAAVGIDAPLGWPEAFTAAVADWSHLEWTKELRDQMRFRLTDFKVRELHGKWPLSVSSDLIALPAMRAMSLLQRHQVTDRSGCSEPFFEVYPAASLKAWGFQSQGYKGSKGTAPQSRANILDSILSAMPWLKCADLCAKDDNLLDALVAALTTHQAFQKETLRPTTVELPTAAKEGWIHLPSAPPKHPV